MLIFWTFLYLTVVFICGYALGFNRHSASEIFDLIAILLEFSALLLFGILIVIPLYPAIWALALGMQMFITIFTQTVGDYLGWTIFKLQYAVHEAAKPQTRRKK